MSSSRLMTSVFLCPYKRGLKQSDPMSSRIESGRSSPPYETGNAVNFCDYRPYQSFLDLDEKVLKTEF